MRLLPKLLVLPVLLIATGASAYTHKKLYDFCAKAGCADGYGPIGGLIADAQGNLYGNTFRNGRFGDSSKGGTIFEMVKGADGFTMKTLHNFCAKPQCADGSLASYGGLIIDTNGNLYGTAGPNPSGTGPNSGGVVYKLSHNADRSHWTLKVLYAFCSVKVGQVCTDGEYPIEGGLTYAGEAAGVPYDGVSPLYGTTGGGGTATGHHGVVYRLSRNAHGRWAETVLYSFCVDADCNDGSEPSASLTIDGAGNIFGVTYLGGANVTPGGRHEAGTVFELSPGPGDSWTHTVLYSFCALAHCPDGRNPNTQLTLDAQGNLLGTTYNGGSRYVGVVFKLVPDGTASQESVLYTFCPQPGCPDGDQPLTPMLIEASGDMLGATNSGGEGRTDHGVVYRLSGATQEVLHAFCQERHCTDGDRPYGKLFVDAQGNIFGVTLEGGTHTDPSATAGGGTVYELSPD